MKKIFPLLFLFFAAINVFSQTTLFSDGFENGQSSWQFSTNTGGNDYKITTAVGYLSDYAIRCKLIGTPNFMISPSITFATNIAHKIRFMAKSATVNTRKIEVYYSSTAALDANAVLVGSTPYLTTTYAQYSFDIINPPAGNKYIIFKGIGINYVFMYIDNVEILTWPNYKPTVSITTPLNNTTSIAGQSLSVKVDAADTDGSIKNVKLIYRGETYSTLNSPPYDFTINNIPIGASSLYAIAYDNYGDSTISETVNVTGINNKPLCQLTLPATNITINQGEAVSLLSTANDSDGSIASVSFYVGGIKVSTDSISPYSFIWSNSNPGIYPVYAVATDNTGLNGFSDTITINSVATSVGYLLTENFENGENAWSFSTNSGGNDWLLKSDIGVNGTTCMRRKNTTPLNNMLLNKKIFCSAGNYSIKASLKAGNANNQYKIKAALINGTDTIWSSMGKSIGTSWMKDSVNIICTKSDYYTLLIKTEASVSGYVEFFIDDISMWGAGGFANAQPVIKITSPINSSEAALNVPINFTSVAYDTDGTISKVEYFIGNQKIGESTSMPFTVVWTPTYPGVFSIKAVATDNLGKINTKFNNLFVNYADRKVYDISASSYLGAEAGSGKVWGTAVQSDGTIVLACDWGKIIPNGVVLHLLNGANADSRGAIVRISSDGKKLLSITKMGNYAIDIALDGNDNIFVAAGTSGMVKLNKWADAVVYNRIFTKNVYRIDAGKTGYSTVLTRAGVDFDDKKWDAVSVFVLNPNGDVMSSFGGASTNTNDVCIDETTQTVVEVGWRNTYTSDGVSASLPVDIPGIKAYSFSGLKKFEGYNWSNDNKSLNWVNRSENNMADSRLARCSMGQDGLLYIGGECSGGNHQFRYSPFDIMTKVRFVGGDYYHNLSNTGTEFHTFIGRMNLETSEYIEGQTFTCRLPNSAGNTLQMEHGNVNADKDGRVYFTGASAYGLPLTKDSLASLNYTGGAFIYIMNPSLQYRELVDRVIFKNTGRDVTVRKFDNHDMSIVYGGDVSFDAIGTETQAQLFAKQPFQNTFIGAATQVSGFFALIGGTTPKKYDIIVDGKLLGSYAEGEKILLTAPIKNNDLQFSNWSGGGDYISDSTNINATISLPGKNFSMVSVYNSLSNDVSLIKSKLEIFPNPTCNYVKISTGVNSRLNLSISDLTGKKVFEDIIVGNKTIDLSEFSKGIYIVTVGKSKQKLIKY